MKCILIASFVFLIACQPKQEYIGTWSGMSDGKETVVDIKSDGSVSVSWGDRKRGGFWELNQDGNIIFFEKRNKATVKLDNGNIIITEGDSSFKLSKQL